MARMSAKEAELRILMRDDFEAYARTCLRIRTKSGATEPLLLNRSQRFLHARLEAQRKETGKVRALVLKGRQIGCSTYVAGRFYHRCTHNRGYRTFVMGHLDMSSDNLFNIAKRLHDNCPDMLRPQTGAANAKELLFPALGSGYRVTTAGSKDVGRSETIQLMHGSEFGYWPNGASHFSGIMQAVPDEPGTEIVLESTANGVGNTFHSLWRAAERGESDFIAVMIPWHWHEEYRSPPPPDWRCPEGFAAYAAAHDLSPEQTHWAWRKNRELALASGGTVDSPCWEFQREYAATASEAF